MLTARADEIRKNPRDEDEGRGPDTESKFVGMFQRRVEKGQCFHRPYLGCREFACHFAPPSPTDRTLAGWSGDLGLMLYDLRFGADGRHRPGFFLAAVTQGVLHCDTAPTDKNQPPVQVLGWDDEGGAA